DNSNVPVPLSGEMCKIRSMKSTRYPPFGTNNKNDLAVPGVREQRQAAEIVRDSSPGCQLTHTCMSRTANCGVNADRFRLPPLYCPCRKYVLAFAKQGSLHGLNMPGWYIHLHVARAVAELLSRTQDSDGTRLGPNQTTISTFSGMGKTPKDLSDIIQRYP